MLGAIGRRLSAQAPELDPLTLRFADPEAERAFRLTYFQRNLLNLRLAHVLAVLIWAVFGILAQSIVENRVADAVIRFGILIPAVLLSLVFTYTVAYPRVWEQVTVGILLVNAFVWISQLALSSDVRVDWIYVPMLLLLQFGFTFLRLPFVPATITGVIVVLYYTVATLLFSNGPAVHLLFADFFLITGVMVGMAAAYTLEWQTRLLFLSERQLEGERQRSESLLLNVLPRPIAERLKARPSGDEKIIADGHEEATILFIDLVGFTDQAARATPQEIVSTLDYLFTQFDALADLWGLEKIKTVGDAYMAVAGVPAPRTDHADAAAAMALAALDVVREVRWPSGEGIQVRIGLASGPAVAGVIGRRKFAYDLWGDTVNLASRLESHGEPGRIHVSEATYELIKDRYVFSESHIVELRGKGSIRTRFLMRSNA